MDSVQDAPIQGIAAAMPEGRIFNDVARFLTSNLSEEGATLDERYNAIHAATAILLKAIRADWDPGTKDTPARVAKMWLEELAAGVDYDPAEHLSKVFDEDFREMVAVHDVPFYSTCCHHLVPFYGVAHIGYIPQGKVVGLSKLARVLEGYSRQPSVQERITAQVADAIEEHLQPLGTIVVLRATHMCMCMRGVQKPGSLTTTSAVRGVFKERDNLAREEFFALVGRGNG
jgi:GTP cyclohydrolase I